MWCGVVPSQSHGLLAFPAAAHLGPTLPHCSWPLASWLDLQRWQPAVDPATTVGRPGWTRRRPPRRACSQRQWRLWRCRLPPHLTQACWACCRPLQRCCLQAAPPLTTYCCMRICISRACCRHPRRGPLRRQLRLLGLAFRAQRPLRQPLLRSSTTRSACWPACCAAAGRQRPQALLPALRRRQASSRRRLCPKRQRQRQPPAGPHRMRLRLRCWHSWRARPAYHRRTFWRRWACLQPIMLCSRCGPRPGGSSPGALRLCCLLPLTYPWPRPRPQAAAPWSMPAPAGAGPAPCPQRQPLSSRSPRLRHRPCCQWACPHRSWTWQPCRRRPAGRA